MSQEDSAAKNIVMVPPSQAPQMNHGRTVAGWALFWAASLGMLVVAIGAILFNTAVIIAGVVIVIVGLVLSGVLRMMGHGQPVTKRAAPTVEDL